MIKFTKSDSKNGFGLLGVIFVIAIIGVVIGGGSYFKELQQQKSLLDIGRDAEKQAQKLKKKIEAEQNELIGENLDTSTWKTYRNEKYGFRFNYPYNWRITGDDNLDVHVGKPTEGVDDDMAGLEIMFRWHFETFGKDIKVIENFEINGHKAIKTTYQGNQKGFNGFSFYVIKNSDNYLAIDTFNYDGKEREQSDKIINEIVRSVTFF